MLQCFYLRSLLAPYLFSAFCATLLNFFICTNQFIKAQLKFPILLLAYFGLVKIIALLLPCSVDSVGSAKTCVNCIQLCSVKCVSVQFCSLINGSILSLNILVNEKQ